MTTETLDAIRILDQFEKDHSYLERHLQDGSALI